MRDQLLKFINKCMRNRRPDLHSFVIEIEGGKAFVNSAYGEVQVIVMRNVDGLQKREDFAFNPFEAADWLVKNGAKLETLEQ